MPTWGQLLKEESTAEERLYKPHPGMRQRRITPRNPIRTTRQRRAHGASAGTISMRFGDALLPPLGAAHPHRKNRHPSARYTAIGENRRRAVSHVSTGLTCLPRDTGGMRNYRRRAVVERCCVKGRRLLQDGCDSADSTFPKSPMQNFLQKYFP